MHLKTIILTPMDKRLELTPQQIAQKYVDEIITDEYLMNIGEIRVLDAISWFDETYPNLTDHQRTLFSEELDRLFPVRMIAALERQNKAEEESNQEKAELLNRIRQCVKNLNFIEARQLLDEYKKRYQS